MKGLVENRPLVVDDGSVLMEDQIGFLQDDIGTEKEWVAIGVNDEDGFAEVVALAHPKNAVLIVNAVNHHDRLVEELKKAERFMSGFEDCEINKGMKTRLSIIRALLDDVKKGAQ